MTWPPPALLPLKVKASGNRAAGACLPDGRPLQSTWYPLRRLSLASLHPGGGGWPRPSHPRPLSVYPSHARSLTHTRTVTPTHPHTSTRTHTVTHRVTLTIRTVLLAHSHACTRCHTHPHALTRYRSLTLRHTHTLERVKFRAPEVGRAPAEARRQVLTAWHAGEAGAAPKPNNSGWGHCQLQGKLGGWTVLGRSLVVF